MAFPKFDEPATTWKGAFRRAAAFSAPHLCGSYIIGKLVGTLLPKPFHELVMVGLLLLGVPILTAVINRSWRVGVASATIAMAIIGFAFIVVGIIFASAR